MTSRRRYPGLGESFTVAGLIAYADKRETDAKAEMHLAGALRAAARRLECPECTVLVVVPVSRTTGELSPLDAYGQHELVCTALSRR
jgi:hypothetical protein